MAASNRDNVFEQIQSICREYRKRLKSGQSANIADDLLRIDESARETLFQNLLHLDIEFYRRRGDDPSSESYIERFPQFARLIRQAFFESTMMSQEFDGDTPDADTPTVTLGIPAAKRIGEYELLRELGRGGFGVVYEARHLQRGDHVALKTLPMISDGKSESAQDAERLHRFRKEFRSLAEINHPNLVGMQTLEVDGEQWFITMDLLEGVDFLSYVRPAEQLDESRLRSSLKQLTRGIATLHQRGIVHRDLKPNNVLLRSDGQLVILDFGLAAELQQLAGETLSVGTQRFVGTPRYAAPEQIAGERTSAIDWYAAGVMLYEAITGESPFTGKGLQVLVEKQNNEASQLAGRQDVPADLANLVDHLLQREPKHRPDSEFMIQALGIAEDSTSRDSTSIHISMSSMSSVDGDLQLFGREKQLAELDRTVQSFLRARQPACVFIKGRSGEGKTALINFFLSKVQRNHDVLILSGRCYDRESVPFKAIDCLIDPLVDHLRRRHRDELLEILSEDIVMLAHLFPVLRRVECISERSLSDISNLDRQQVRYRAFAALKELLTKIGWVTPIILFVDDLQWGDADSARALHETVSSANPPAVLLIGSYRSDEADESPYLIEWEKSHKQASDSILQHEISVSPLNQTEAVTLFAERLEIPEETIRTQIEQVFDQTHGNPYFLEQLIDGFDRETRQFAVVPLSTTIAERLGRLEQQAKPLLEAIAIAGQSVALDEAARVAEIDENAFKTVTHMRSERLLRIIGSVEQPTIDTYHDKIRETVLESLADSQRRSLHVRYGELLENLAQIDIAAVDQYFRTAEGEFPDSARFFDLSFHFSRAKDSRKASVYGYLAAKQAKEQFSLETAVEHFRDAYAHCCDGGKLLRYAIALRLGECLQLLGRFAEAETVLREGHELAETLANRVEIELCLAETMRGAGRFEDSAKQYVASLKSLGVYAPEDAKRLVFQLLTESIVHLKRTLLWKPKPKCEKNDRLDVLRVRAFAGYMWAVWFRSLPTVAWTVLAGVNRAERLKPSAERAIAEMTFGAIVSIAGIQRHSETYLNRARSQIGDNDLSFLLLHFLFTAAANHSQGRFLEAVEACRSGLKLAPRVGDIPRSLIMRLFLVLSHYRQGQLGSALKDALEEFERSVQLGDRNTAHDQINSVAMISGGQFDFPAMKACLRSMLDNHQATNQVIIAEARWHLFHGRTEPALACATAAYDLIEQKVVINFVTSPTMPLLLESTRCHALSIQSGSPEEAKQLIRKGCRLGRKLALLCKTTPVEEPSLLREWAESLALAGKDRKALRLLRKSCSLAEKMGQQYEHARSQLALATRLHSHGSGNADDVKRWKTNVSEFEQQRRELFDRHPLLQTGSEQAGFQPHQ